MQAQLTESANLIYSTTFLRIENEKRIVRTTSNGHFCSTGHSLWKDQGRAGTDEMDYHLLHFNHFRGHSLQRSLDPVRQQMVLEQVSETGFNLLTHPNPAFGGKSVRLLG